MRRQYFDVVRRRLARGDLAFPFRALWAARRAAKGAEQPILGTLVVTYRCDLDCEMCDLPLRGDKGAEMDTAGLKNVLDGFVELGVLGVGITGGEPLLRKDLLEVVRHGADSGLVMHVNTNGSLVTEEVARGFADAGAASINVSLDGPDAAIHDRLRGRQGSFERVLRAVSRLCGVPRRPYRVALTTALGPENVGQADALLARARDLGVDRVGFLPVHDFGGGAVAPRPAPDRAALNRFIQDAQQDPLVDNSHEYLALFPAAYGGEKNPVRCAAPRTSVVVDCYGEVFPCVPLNAVRKSVGRGDVREVWRSPEYRKVRADLEECRDCFWNCHTEMNLALAKVGGRR